jgi:cell fate regulator YaaT (PSP1 superfamily)
MSDQRNSSRRRRSRRSAPAGRQASAGQDIPASNEPLVIVRFKGERKGYYHNRKAVQVRCGQYCLVQADRGCDLGQVIYLGRGNASWWKEAAKQGILSLASDSDLARLPQLRQEERKAQAVAHQCIQDHGLPMQLVGAERRWDRNKLTFYFLAEGRVDFRILVRDLAGIFRTRIELRQIGVRDDARLKGGIGICGRFFCCSSFLADFNSVSLRMAKDQQLSLNPSKLSGPCGRLRCCLAYEHPAYKNSLKQMPAPGSKALWNDRAGFVRKLDPLRGVVFLQLDDQDHCLVEVPFEELKIVGAGAQRAGDRDE